MDLKLTAGNDTYDQAREDTEWRDYYGLEGDDFNSVYLGNLVGGPGNDRLVHLPGVSWGRVGAAYWDAPKPITADLEAGYAEDGMGGRDILINIDAVLAPWNGGTMYGNALYNHYHTPNPAHWDCGNGFHNKALATAKQRFPECEKAMRSLLKEAH